MSNWIYQQTKKPCHPQPFTFNIGWSFTEFVYDFLALDEPVRIPMIYRDGVIKWYTAEESWEHMQQAAHNKIVDNIKLVKKIKREFSEQTESFLKLSEDIQDLPLSYLSGKELYEWHERYFNTYQDLYPYGEPLPYILKDAYIPTLKGLLGDVGVDSEKVDEVLQTLTTPPELSFVNKEELALAKLAQKRENLTQDEFDKRLKKHKSKYDWIPYDYGVTTWTISDFKERIKELPDGKKLDEKISHWQNYSDNIESQQKKLYDQYNINESDRKKFEALQDLTYLNDYKKETFTRSHVMVRPLHEEIARRLNINWDLFGFMFLQEIEKALVEGGGVDKEKLQSRFDKSVLYFETDKEPVFYTESDADRWINKIEGDETASNTDKDVKNISGQTAAGGLHVGTAKVLHSAEEVNKIESGDVLVATMTSPDYVTAMKRAGAIITDEGGVTSHAAIVSRELEIPCVIGTQNATQVLDDGDEVEVDADNGIVTLIDEE